MNAEFELIGSSWGELRAHIDSEENRINDEITSYPRPIAGCDQQFNYLLEQRDSLQAEKVRLSQSEEKSHGAGNPIDILEDFLNSCAYIGADLRSAITMRLRKFTMNPSAGNDDSSR